MEWAENNDVDYIFGLAGNSVLDALVADTADYLRIRHASTNKDKMRCYTSIEYRAGSWSRPRRVVARLEVSMQPDPNAEGCMRQEVDIRYVVTSLEGDPRHLYEDVYCKRGQMENLIKLHKAQLASDRTSCHSATANQVRLGACLRIMCNHTKLRVAHLARINRARTRNEKSRQLLSVRNHCFGLATRTGS
jgi:Transposase DDE domain group 1